MRQRALKVTWKRPEEESSTAETVAHFLDWMAKHEPGVYLGWHLVAKHVLGYARVPGIHSKETDLVRSAATRARRVLRDLYGRELVSVRYQGVRATVDEGDKLQNALPQRVRYAERAVAAARATMDNIDLAKVPDSAEWKPWKDWLRRDVKDALKLASGLTKSWAALPAPREEAKTDDKKSAA